MLTVCAVVAVFLLRLGLRWLAHLILGGNPQGRVRFWTRQGITLVTSLVLTLTVLSIWLTTRPASPLRSVWSPPASLSLCRK